MKTQSKKYRLYKGFNLIGEFETLYEATKSAPTEDGVYNLRGENFRDTWEIVGGYLYNSEGVLKVRE